MSDRVKVKLDFNGVQKEILKADYMLNYVTDVANSRCGADEHIKPFKGFDRAKAIIYPNTRRYK